MIDNIPQTAGEPISFEDALQKIRDIVTALESGDLTLEESMAKSISAEAPSITLNCASQS
jgi:exonuclease VII small subunit